MAATACITDQYKQDVLNGLHQPADVYKIALFLASAATLNKNTTVYSATGEVGNSGTYAAGGQALVGFTVSLSTDTAYIDWSTDPQWTGATITSDCALIYNSSRSNNAIAVLTFSSTTSTVGTWTLQFPAPGATAVITLT
jgi:hypothetical protein